MKQKDSRMKMMNEILNGIKVSTGIYNFVKIKALLNLKNYNTDFVSSSNICLS